jgi:hypothetical protein
MFRKWLWVCLLILACGGLTTLAWAASRGSPVIHSDTDTATIPTTITDLMRLRQRGSDPSTPPSGEWHLYTKSPGLFLQNSAGSVVEIGTGGGTGTGAGNELTPAALVATTGNITLSGEQTIDGVLTSGSDVVVWLQTTASQNGLYRSASGAWSRRSDLNEAAEFSNNPAIFVTAGTRWAGTTFRLANTGTVVVGTTAIVLHPEASSWYLLPTATVTNDTSLTCNPPTGQWAGAIAPVVGATVGVSLGTPRLVAGVRTNQLCLIEGTSSVTPVTLADGQGAFLALADDVVVFTERVSMLLRWDGVNWREVTRSGGGSGTGAVSLQAAYETGTVGGWTDVDAGRPLTFAPFGATGVKEIKYGESGDIVEECFDSTNLEPCHPRDALIRADRDYRIRALLGSNPGTWIDVETISNSGGTTIVRSDRGDYADLPTASYVNQTYLVVDCADDSCAAGGGSGDIAIYKIWNGTQWVNTGPSVGAGSGDVTQVWGCTTGDCSTLTAASGDSLDAGLADSSKPATRSTDLPVSCSEGQLHQDTNSGGSETSICTSANNWTKLKAVTPWEIPFSAAGLVVDGVNCALASAGTINAGPTVLPVVCLDQPGTLELSFLSPTVWDGTALTVTFVIVDSTTSSHVWAADVKAQCRTPGTDAINATWGTAVPAQATLTTANVPYLASASGLTPNGTCAGGDWVAIHAVILSSGAHTDNNARILGGKISGLQP